MAESRVGVAGHSESNVAGLGNAATPANTALLVPVLNAGAEWRTWVTLVKAQRFQPGKCIAIDSSSDDKTAQLAQDAGFVVHTIPRESFNHGGTRTLGMELADPAQFVIYMTQDAQLEDPEALGRLVAYFADPEVGAVYGRQLAPRHLDPVTAFARRFSYPQEPEVRSREDISRMGFRAAFFSNAFAAYRVEALKAIGGFRANLIAMEDQYAAAQLLLAGWKIAYAADAPVVHAHDYSLLDEFRRYFDFGVFHARESWIRRDFGEPEGHGGRFALTLFKHLARRHPIKIPMAVLRLAARWLAFRLGTVERFLPPKAKRKLSMHQNYWRAGVR